MDRFDQILKLTKQLYPTGRAFNISFNSLMKKFMYALGKSEARAYDDSLSILSQILPDNDDFTAEDATLWENRLNIPVDPPGATLDERKELIARKYAFPGSFIYRQNWRYIEYQLQQAGFNVWVHENRFPDGPGYTYLNPYEIEVIQHSTETEHGYETEMGENNLDIIANSADPNESYDPGIETNYKGAFFIGGETFPDRAIIAPNLMPAFRKLVLTLKPVNTFAILLIDNVYTGPMSFISGDPWDLLDGDPFEFLGGV